MHIIVAMFDTRPHAEEAIDRLVSARCPRDAVTFLPEDELTEIASDGHYDWRKDKWGLWRGLSTYSAINMVDRFTLAEGMHRGHSTLLVAVRNEHDAERFGTVLSEAGAVDLDDLERQWREAGWTSFDGELDPSGDGRRRETRIPRVRIY